MTKYLLYKHHIKDTLYYKVSTDISKRSKPAYVTFLGTEQPYIPITKDFKQYLERNNHLKLGQFTDEELKTFAQLYPELLL